MWILGLIMDWFFDLRLAARALAKRPGFTFVAVLTLALGIGANTVIFSVTDTLLLRPVPFREPDLLMRVLAVNDEIGVRGAGLAVGDFQDLRRDSRSLKNLGAFARRSFDLTGGDTPEVVIGARITFELFSILGVEPIRGRTFHRTEEDPGEGHRVILSHDLWQRHLGGGPALGRPLELDGERYEIVGIMPSGFRFPGRETDLWVPLTVAEGELDRMSHYLGVVGRLRAGVTPEQAAAELERVAAALEEDHPDSNRGWSTRVIPLREHLTRRYRPALLLLSGAVALLLLIACANVANLLVVRAASRQQEIAIRVALGSSRGRLIRVFLVESTLLALVGGVLGVVLASWGLNALGAFAPARIPALADADLDGAALLFTLGVTLVSGLAFGAVPAAQLSRVEVQQLTKEGHGTGGRGSHRLRASLVVAEVALASILLIGASLMLKSFAELQRVDLGFDQENVLALYTVLLPGRYPEVPPQVRFFEGVVDEARALPGVVSAAATSAAPFLAEGQNLLPVEPETGAGRDQDQSTFAEFAAVTPGFFKTLRIPLLAGRDFSTRDDADSRPVLIVNQRLAERFWPGEEAVGKRLLATIWGTEPVAHDVIGVVGNVLQRNLDEEGGPAVYAAYRQVPHRGMVIVARSSGPPLRLAPGLIGRLLELDRNQPVSRVTTLAQLVHDAGGQTRFNTALLSLFGGIALLLAAVGIYGVVAYSFSQRTQELAIRVALGARSRSIVRLVLKEGVGLTLMGVAIGLVGAFVLARLLSSLLYGVSARDPMIFVLVPSLLVAVAVAACWLPSRRALRVDPVTALRGA